MPLIIASNFCSKAEGSSSYDQENAPAVLLHDSMPNSLKLTTLCIASLLESILLPTFPPKHKQNPLNPITRLKSSATKLNHKERALSDCRWARTCNPKIGLWLPQSYPLRSQGTTWVLTHGMKVGVSSLECRFPRCPTIKFLTQFIDLNISFSFQIVLIINLIFIYGTT